MSLHHNTSVSAPFPFGVYGVEYQCRWDKTCPFVR